MAYDALAESVRLIEGGAPGSVPARVSRRVRHVPLAVDVDEPVAATMFLRRGQGTVWFEQHVLVRRRGVWVLVGGGGGTGAEDTGPEAPGRDGPGGLLDVGGSGSVHVGGAGLPRVVRYATVRAAREVATVLVGERVVPVPRHGWLIAVWPDRRAPRLVALDAAGAVLATAGADPGSDRPGLPEVYRDPAPG